MSLADKCIVVGCFVCWGYDKNRYDEEKIFKNNEKTSIVDNKTD